MLLYLPASVASVLQALYFCRPFREKVLQYRQQTKKVKEESLLSVLADLFHNTTSQKKRVGTIAPKKFIARVSELMELVDGVID